MIWSCKCFLEFIKLDFHRRKNLFHKGKLVVSNHPQHLCLPEQREQRVASETRVQAHGERQAAPGVVLFFDPEQRLEVLEYQSAGGLVAHRHIRSEARHAVVHPGANDEAAKRHALPVLGAKCETYISYCECVNR